MSLVSWGPVAFSIEGSREDEGRPISDFLLAGGCAAGAPGARTVVTVSVSIADDLDGLHAGMIEGARLQARVAAPGYDKTLHVDGSSFVWRYGVERCVIRLETERRLLSVAVESGETLGSGRFLNIALMESLQWALMMEGVPFVHAAGIVRNGRGILLSGPPGEGKSIVSLALARAGYELSSDDSVGLLRGEEGPAMLFSPEWIGLVEEAGELFPRLSAAIAASACPVIAFRRKLKVPVPALGMRVSTAAAPIRHFVTLRKSGDPAAPRLSRVTAAECLDRLFDSLVLFDAEGFPGVSRSHAESLFDLASSAVFYELSYSPSNLAALPRLFDETLFGEPADAA